VDYRLETMTQTTEPTSVYAGDTVAWTKVLSDYPASLWTLTYSLVRDGGSITIVATANGDAYAISVPAATTATWLPAEYTWTAYVSDVSSRFTVETGAIRVKANPASGGYDARSQCKRTLDAVNSLLEGRASSDVSSYSIGGRSISKMAISELILWKSKLEAQYAGEIAADRIARGLGTGRKILTRL
jgi:hypothetical protein